MVSYVPHMEEFVNLQNKGLEELTILKGVGVEKLAEHAFNFENELVKEMTDNRG